MFSAGSQHPAAEALLAVNFYKVLVSTCSLVRIV